MKTLTDKQQSILDFISEFSHKEGMAPTIFEISEKFNIKTATAYTHVRSLQRKGYINRSSKARSMLLTKNELPENISMMLSVPILGRISAGVPFLAEEHIERHIQVDPKTLPAHLGSSRLFGLEVHGESMRDLGILDGDVIIAKQTQEPSIGDIVVAMIDGETTVKSLFLTDNKWELRPANPDFCSRFVPLNKLQIQGVVIALQRIFR